MTKKTTIEKVNSQNFDDFFNLLKKMASYEKQKKLDKKIKQRIQNDCLSNPPKINVYLTNFDKQYIGYIIFYYTYSSYLALPTLHIEDLFILEDYRRKGIGKKMFDFCAKKAVENSCGRMEWCVYNWNQPAIDFYKKNNATCLNKKYYRLTKKEIKKLAEGFKGV